MIIPIFFEGRQEEKEMEENKCYSWENKRCVADFEEYCEEMQGECPMNYKDCYEELQNVSPAPFFQIGPNSWFDKYHKNNRSGCCCCRNRSDFARMLDYDYKEYRKNCYANLFKEADCNCKK